MKKWFTIKRQICKSIPVVCLLLPCVLALIPLFSTAQYSVVNIPAIQKQIALAKEDSTKARLYGVLGWSLRFSDTKESERLAEEMIRLSSPVNDYLRLAEAYRIKGFARVLEQKLTETLDMYAIGTAYANKAKSGYMLAHFKSLIAGMYQDKGDFDKAISFYLEGLKIAEDYKDSEMIATLANNLAEAYSDAGRPIGFTLPLYQQALKQEMLMGNWQYVGMIYSNMAKEYMLAGQGTEAEQSAKKAIDFIHKQNDRAYVYATVVSDIGEMYVGMKKFAQAEKYLREGFHILDSIGTKDNKLIPLSALAKMYILKNETAKAEAAAKQLLVLATAYKTKLFLRDGYKVMSDVARKKNQPALALTYFEQYKNWNDSLFNESKEKSIANVESRMQLNRKALEVRYETEKKARENTALKISNAGLKNQTVAAIIIAVMVSFIGMGLFTVNRIRKKKNGELEKQKQIIQKQSEEKDTLIREINHRVKNNLQIISSLLNLQANSLSDAGAIDALRDSHKRVKAISLIHQKLYGFEDIASIPLEEYITALFADLKMIYAANSIRLICKTTPANLYLDIESAVPVGLILNETITNALKYAFVQRDTGTVKVAFTEDDHGYYSLVIEDDGVGLPEGFNPDTSPSLGFRIIKELIRQLRGQFMYTTQQGTLFAISFPNTTVRKTLS